jgi:DNA-binding transcriptional MocR family regulator
MDSLASGRFSRRVSDLAPSPIREILAVIERPGMISFAGGLPAAETFPQLSLAGVPPACLQYGATEGDAALRARVAENLALDGIRCTPEQVLILSGSQQGIDLAAKLFVDGGTPVAVEAPTYLAALQVFRYFGAAFETLDPRSPAAGMARGSLPALAYVNPTFQNPTGHCYDAAERATVAAACDELGVPLLEDDPYRDLAYEACERVPICARLERASWIYQSSFSKSLAPGLRLGYLAASPDLVPLLTRLKQAADLHSNRVSQWLVLQQLQDPRHTQRLADLAAAYRDKRDIFAAALHRHFAGLARWDLPPGGLFFWLRLTGHLDTRELLPQAIARGVAFMPGEFFFPGRAQPTGTLRLNFSHAGEQQVEGGLEILAELIRTQVAGR